MDYPRSERLKGYRLFVDFELESGGSPFLRELRESVSVLSLESVEQAELEQIDSGVIEFVVTLDGIDSYLLRDDAAKPLERWWWHLGKLRAGTYPADLLPPHLRAIYGASRETA